MKLKQRAAILSAVTAICLMMCLVCVTYYFVENYPEPSEEMILNDYTGDVAKVTAAVWHRQSKRKLAKRQRQDYNSSYYDSDRAVEVDVSGGKYEDLFQIGKDIKWESKVASPSYIRKSKGCESEFPYSEDSRKRARFADLLQFLDEARPENSPSAKLRLTLQEIHGIGKKNDLSPMDLFHIGISDLDLYSEDDPNVEELIKDMATKTIVHVEEKAGGTQLKLIITFQDGSQCLFKPMRFNRSKETEPDHFYFVDYERHTSEIATFHLDRLLGFRRCPPVVGRRLNVTTEIYAVAEDELIATFFISPAGNICFHGTCSTYCDTGHAICGHPDVVEGSLAAYLPPDSLSGRKSWKNPWRRSYHKRRKAEWEVNDDFCDTVRKRPYYSNPKRLASLVDMSILDFLIGNMDRHHYETFKVFGNDSFILHLDHGRGFGRPNHDELSILAPLYQCCFVSLSTFRRLLEMQHGRTPLSAQMRCSLAKDPVAPVVLEKHLKALDRRLETVLNVIKECLQRHDSASVLYSETMQ